MGSSSYIDPQLHVGLFTRLRPWLGMLILAVAAFAVCAPSLDGEFLRGDETYVAENELLQEAGGLGRIWFEPSALPQYYPVLHTTFWMQYQLHELNPGPYRVFNLLLHVVNALLLLMLLRALKVPGAWLAAAIFLLHPINVESVAWIAQRKNMLSLFFYLLAICAFSRAYGLFDSIAPRGKWGWYGVGCVLFLGAMFSKTVACTMPAALLLLIWWKRGTLPVRSLLETLPLFGVAVIVGLTAVLADAPQAHVQSVQWDLTFVERVLAAGRAFWFYVVQWLVPVRHTFIYPQWTIDASAGWAYLFPLTVLLVVVLFWLLRRRLGRGPLVAVLLYGGLLLPASGLFDFYPMPHAFVADHFQYHAGIGVIVLIAAGLALLGHRKAADMFVREQEFTRWIFGALSLPILGVLGFWSWQYAHVFHNEIALWRDTIEKNPAAQVAYTNLADALEREKRTAEAEQLLQRALDRHPNVMEAPFNVGRLLQDVGQYEEAADYYRRALEIDPDYVPAYNRLGTVLYQTGSRQEALAQWAAALERDPDSLDAHEQKARAWAAMGRLEEAIEAYRRVLALSPDNQRALFRMGVLFYRQGEYEEAAGAFRETLAREPDHAHALNNLGLSLSRMGRPEDALVQYDLALEVLPEFAQAWYNRGVALERLGRYTDARTSYQTALEADPAFEPARRSLEQLDAMEPLL